MPNARDTPSAPTSTTDDSHKVKEYVRDDGDIVFYTTKGKGNQWLKAEPNATVDLEDHR